MNFKYYQSVLFFSSSVQLCCCHWLVAKLCPTLVVPWTVALQVPFSTRFSRQEYWSGLPCPPPEDLPDPGIESTSLLSPALAGGFFTSARPGNPLNWVESESESEVAQSCPTLSDPMDYSPPGPPSMGFPRQEYWSGLPFSSPGDLPDLGI